MRTKNRFVIRKPCRGALWAIWDHGEQRYAYTGCLSYAFALRRSASMNERDTCAHDDHDHGICIDCGLDRTDHFVSAAEYAFEGDR